MNAHEDFGNSQLGVEIPERCKNCPRIGSVVTELTMAIDEQTEVTTMLHSDPTVALCRDLSDEARRFFPSWTDEQIDAQVELHIASILSNDATSRNKISAGKRLITLDETIKASIDEVKFLTGRCLTQGCDTK